MAKQAASRIGFGMPANPSAVSDDQLQTVLSVGVQELGEPFFSELIKQGKASDDQAFRREVFLALGRTEDPELTKVLRNEILGDDLTRREAGFLLMRQLARTATNEVTWAWVQDSYRELLDHLLGGTSGGPAISFFGDFLCEAKQAEELKALAEEFADYAPGYEQGLAQALETIALCVTLKEAKSAELAEAFRSLNPKDGSP
jgi:hypothetical protein